jgi:hypothetical protein
MRIGRPGLRKYMSLMSAASGWTKPPSVIVPCPAQNAFQSTKKSLYADRSPLATRSWNCGDSTEAWLRMKSSFSEIPASRSASRSACVAYSLFKP